MVKPKQRHLKAAQQNSSNTEWNEDESWVIVKKLRITILVPPLQLVTKSTMPNLGPSQLQAMPRKTLNEQSEFSNEMRSEKPLVDEQEKSALLAPDRGIQTARRTPRRYISTIARPPIIDYRTEPIARPQIIDFRTGPENPNHVQVSEPHNILEVLDTSKTIKQSRSLHIIGGSLDRTVLLNQRLRALNLERKLKKAGGLSNWLASLGLEQFVRLFKGKSINKFQLVNLTMKKLKDMGADAVGPRRKLMHAIECVCQPYCFEPSQVR